MPKKLKIILLFIAMALINGCISPDEEEYREYVTEIENEGKLPQLMNAIMVNDCIDGVRCNKTQENDLNFSQCVCNPMK